MGASYNRYLTLLLLLASLLTVVNAASMSSQYVCTFYYPWYGHYNHWDGNSFPPDSWFSNYLPDTDPDLFDPSKELYDSMDPETIKWQLRLMKKAGIQVAISSWWGISTYEDEALEKILTEIMPSIDCPYRDLKWCIYYEKEGYDNPEVDEICDDLTYIIERYGESPYLFRIDGKIVVFVWNSGGDSGDYSSRWLEVREKMGNIYTVLKVYNGYNKHLERSDSWHQYAPAMRYESQGDFSAFVSPGFWMHGEGILLERDTVGFEAAVRRLKNSGCQFLTVQTWNEWHEGTQVEPGQPINPVSPYTAAGDSYGESYIEILGEHLKSFSPPPMELEILNPVNGTILLNSTCTVSATAKSRTGEINDMYLSMDGETPVEMTEINTTSSGFFSFICTKDFDHGNHTITIFAKDSTDRFSRNINGNLRVVLPFQFELVMETNMEMRAGSKTELTVSLNHLNGKLAPVKLDITKLPMGVVANISSVEIMDEEVSITLEVNEITVPGEYTFIIQGRTNSSVKRYPITLVIEEYLVELRVEVLDKMGQRLENAQIVLSGEEEKRSVKTDEYGVVEFKELQRGDYTINCTLEGFYPKGDEVTLQTSEKIIITMDETLPASEPTQPRIPSYPFIAVATAIMIFYRKRIGSNPPRSGNRS